MHYIKFLKYLLGAEGSVEERDRVVDHLSSAVSRKASHPPGPKDHPSLEFGCHPTNINHN